MKCRICNNSKANNIYEVREMMFGYRDIFRYIQCSKCNCLQIEEFPTNISRYYPYNYYSYRNLPKKKLPIKILVNMRDRYALWTKGFLGKILYKMFPRQNLRHLACLSIEKTTRILDVGCGNGNLLYSLCELGMKNLLGVDPFIPKDIVYENGLKIARNDLVHIGGKWDVVIFHHSFEHIADPIGTMGVVSKLLSPKGKCLIWIPTVSSFAWKHYGVNWVQLDAPRHFYLHSVESMRILANSVGLELYKVAYDSSAFQFWGSEQYVNDVPLQNERSYLENKKTSIFSMEEIHEWGKRAEELNNSEQGDQAVFYFRGKMNNEA